MSDVFISYSSRDRARAHELADALAARGRSVWWDREIGTGQAFDAVIERELYDSRCVVVLWSHHAVSSEWVKNEAAVAAERGVLLPAQLDETRPPLEFRRKQTADLSDWRPGHDGHPGFAALCRAIDAACESPGEDRAVSGTGPSSFSANPVTHARESASKPALAAPRRVVLAGVAAALIAAIAFGTALVSRQADDGPTTRATASPPPSTGSGPVDASVGPRLEAPEARTNASVGQGVDLADRVVGRYAGEVVSDSKGPSGRRLVITLEKIGADAVIARSPYKRIDDLRFTLTEASGMVINLDGETPFIVDLNKTPMTLDLNPRNELAFHGVRQ